MFSNYKKIKLQNFHFYKLLPNSFSNKRWVKGYLGSFLGNHILTYPTPRNLSYAWSFGSLAGICLVTQILSGLFLAMHYTPDMNMAFNSVEYIMRDVKNGWLIRYIHSNGASMFFLVVYCHIFRGLYYGSYMRPRRLLWNSGVILYVLMMATAFTGYVLPWGQMSFWGATVITSFVTALPLVGQPIVTWLWGGFIVSNATLKRFYSIHFFLPFVIAGLSLIHLVLLHKDGSNNPLGSDGVGDEVSFYPYFVIKDVFAFFSFLLIYSCFVLYSPNVLSHPDNYIPANPLNTPHHVVPEWYFLAFYAILRSIPHKVGGIIAMGGAILVLFTIPFSNSSRVRSTTYRPVFKIFYWLFVADFLILSWLGQQPVRDTFIWVGQIATIYYFLFFLVLIPLTGTFELKLASTRIVSMDAPEVGQKILQDPATQIMEGLLHFNGHLFILIISIVSLVGWLLVSTIYSFKEDSIKVIKPLFVHAKTIEIIWTSVPALILLTLASPSFSLIYSMDELAAPELTLKIIGHQWFWDYEISDYVTCLEDENTRPLKFAAYLLAEEDLKASESKGYFRLLETNKRVVLPVNTNIRLAISSVDVLHSWTIPSCGVKVDACPGRLNLANLFLKRIGLVYGQCSEICGVDHGFMPINAISVSSHAYAKFIADVTPKILNLN
jgi:quinol-cytochrome oxidoreductase complex cytochrome b subunit/heme/copper-type cytochrome/quinol oxidase subunit 2